ncbi:FAD-binding and (Fe-S)-binding domain-containing protein [Myroides sp. LJL119]
MNTLLYQEYIQELSLTLPKANIISDPLQCLAYSADASFYRLIPKVVVFIENEAQIISALYIANSKNLPVSFRAAGTSLSGQAQSDSILLIATKGWNNFTVFDQGYKAKFQPGITGAKANAILRKYDRKIGPDPGSINAAMIGGIAANNASGMCCGTSENSYNTLADIRIILCDGTILDTGDDLSKQSFLQSHAHFIKQINSLASQVKSNTVLHQRIARKYKIKNTTGYSLNALIDFTDPFDIIKHLIIGSEGTLAFISDITYHTVENFKYKSCSLVLFQDIHQACLAVPLLKQSPVSAVELMDRNSIRSIENEPLAPSYFKTLGESTCVLLIEARGTTPEDLENKENLIKQSIKDIPTLRPFQFTSDPDIYAFNWKARNGLLPSVGALRKTGTTCIIEDVGFDVKDLAAATTALKKLFAKLEYKDAVLFGHALEGNLHLVFSQDFQSDKQIARYAKLMDGIVDIVVNQFDGSLKAEHGTGRNMAPFVEKEWGKQAYETMQEIKFIFDPKNLLNPGVILNSNAHVHLENLKPTQPTHPIIDKCIECGFCESQCVSHNFTLSPRGRIVVSREIQRLKTNKQDPKVLQELLKKSNYFVDQTCATDGLCSLACPVGIDTGMFVKTLRARKIKKGKNKATENKPFPLATLIQVARISLGALSTINRVMGDKLMYKSALRLRKISNNKLPLWNPYMPGPTKKDFQSTYKDFKSENKIVYFPSCINRAMGKSKFEPPQDKDLIQTTISLLNKAGYQIILPENLSSLCCSMPFSSKGYKKRAKEFTQTLQESLKKYSNNGQYPVLFDMSPCYSHFCEQESIGNLKIYDPVSCIVELVLPNLPIKKKVKSVDIFAVCSLKKDSLTTKLYDLAKACSEKVNLLESNCCGFSGDKGFFIPELNKHGTKDLKSQITPNTNGCYSTSRTCEIGLSFHTQQNFKSIFYLIQQVT